LRPKLTLPSINGRAALTCTVAGIGVEYRP
jgi:hypothetical protein